VPGMFAGGDVHSGSPNRMSCAVGEGHALAVSVYHYLTDLRKRADAKLVLLQGGAKA
ncbi:MAG: hypothetical protein JWL75_233, partial [Parcubacteria group bacterium]|nr:hypothetical protein [Parcubacteria group bacterium]